MIKSKMMNSLWSSLFVMAVIAMCCCPTTQGCDEKLSGTGDSGYRGCQTKTRSGKTCQAWASQSPHEHSRTPANYPNSGLEKNYCRNPDGESTIWCYTTDSGSRWELCDPRGWRNVVANEDDLVDTCTNECSDISYLESAPAMLKKNCKVVKDCYKLSTGWTRGFVRCDYCQCKCEDSRAVIPEVIEVKTTKQFTEPALYGTCTTTCPRSGLVRTDWGGCKQVRNCRKSHNGWTRGFVRCDYCVCDCINHKYENKYILRNVKYSLDESSLKPGDPVGLSKMPVTNDQDVAQTSSVTMTFGYTNSLEVSTTTSLTTGLSITVESGVNIKAFSATLSTTATIEAGYSTTSGKVEQESHSDSVTASLIVQPGRNCEVQVFATVMNLDIPYTADLVTVYSDGSESVTPTSGIFTGVETKQFQVLYPPCSLAPGTTPVFTRNPPTKN